jgi:hypothetical protein
MIKRCKNICCKIIDKVKKTWKTFVAWLFSWQK